MEPITVILGFIFGPAAIVLVILLLVFGLKVVNQYEKGVKFTFGKYTGIMEPGLNFVFPIIQSWERIDMRTTVIDVPSQDAMSRDNVSVNINAVLYFKVTNAKLAVLEIEDYYYAASQLSQITMKNIVGESSLDELLSNRDQISNKIREVVDKATDPWGIKVEGVDLKHIEVSADLKRIMAKEAEAEREKRAVIIKSEGELIAAENMVKAARQLKKAPGGLHIRTLHTINNLAANKSHTKVYAIPMELLRLIQRLK